MDIKRLFVLVLLILVNAACLMAQETVSITDITSGRYRAQTISDIQPLEGVSRYAQISDDGQMVVSSDFSTGLVVDTIVDVAELTDIDDCALSVDGYVLSPNGKMVLIQYETNPIYRHSFTADYVLYDKQQKKSRHITRYNDQQQVPQFSPDSRWIAYVKDNNIFLQDVKSGTLTTVTTDGVKNKIINGIPDWVYEEEFSFNSAYVFNADATSLCWLKFDESDVATYSLQLYRGQRPAFAAFDDYPGEYSYKYPKAGYANSKVSAWSYDIASGKTLRINLPTQEDDYIPRIFSTEDPNQILLLTLNRHQDHLCVYSANPHTGTCERIIEEHGDRYIKEEVLENIKITKEHILLPSDRDGFMHLYLYDLKGNLVRQIDAGDYDVDEVYGYDEKTGRTYFSAARPTPSERQVIVADKKGTITPIASKRGWNTAVFSSDFKYFVNRWSDADTPYIYDIFDNKGKYHKTLLNNQGLRDYVNSMNLSKKEFFSFTTSEGVTLNGWMLRPADFDPQRKYPVVMHQYGGPGSQQVVNSWSIGSMGQGGMFDYYLTQHGCIVVCVDGRGTGFRGSEFEKCTYLKIGELEARDQVETALWLGKQNYVDADRIAIWGWSYGGFNTLMSMSEGRPVFRAGVAIAPPTNWKYYDTVYTERYMRTPEENPDGYAINPINRAEQLHGALLICHGLADDNVHPQNTFEYTEALVQEDKDFKEQIYTNRNHGIYGGNTRNHLLRQVSSFILKELGVED